MMSRLRLVIAWLLMAALPLQGLAAATMAFCGPAHEHQSTRAMATMADEHGGAHDHSQHAHATEIATAADGGHDAAQDTGALPDVSHKCGVCASCCHGIALAGLPHWPAFVPLPQGGLAEPFVPIHATPSELPDKPPRA